MSNARDKFLRRKRIARDEEYDQPDSGVWCDRGNVGYRRPSILMAK